MTKRSNSDRPIGSGYGDGSKRTQFAKGKSGNPKGRRRKPRMQTIGLYQILMEKVSITRNGKTKKVPFPVAHIERLKERAAKGDPKADQALFKLYKDLDLFGQSTSSDEPYEFTLRIGRTKGGILDDDAVDSASQTIDKPRDPNNCD